MPAVGRGLLPHMDKPDKRHIFPVRGTTHGTPFPTVKYRAWQLPRPICSCSKRLSLRQEPLFYDSESQRIRSCMHPDGGTDLVEPHFPDAVSLAAQDFQGLL